MTTSSSFTRLAAALIRLSAALARPVPVRAWFTVRLHLCIEPLARVAPDALKRPQFHTQGFSGFIVRQAQKIFHFYHVTPIRFDAGQFLEQLVDGERRFELAAFGGQEIFESFQRDKLGMGAS